jgi:hypothetical protein
VKSKKGYRPPIDIAVDEDVVKEPFSDIEEEEPMDACAAYLDEDEPTGLLPSHRQLLFAIIERAYLDCKSPKQKVKREGVHYLMSDSVDDWSFLWVVDHLKMHKLVKIIRRRISKYH